MSEAIEAPEGNNRLLNRFVATTVVILSVAMAISNIKDGNIVQTMQADQASKVDLWNEYQATRIKGHDQKIAAILLRQDKNAEAQAAAADADREAKRYAKEAADLKTQALAAQSDYDVQGRRDDQFDLGDGFMSIALAVAAISALVESFWLLGGAWIAAGLGLIFTVAGFAELSIHPDALVDFLT
jgi:hypothetical protein